ncbi:MAG: helix-turn-helix domain-containing protein [Pyrinomonadaceae bacterium]|nr:helix-turn-helix domain-containing protein [Pyrinomonadaceae bacterium]
MSKINSNLLALRRKHLAYEQKQIALLLGHKTIHQISRYETGQRIPSLREAMKLSILYGFPIHKLFSRHYQQCREELRKVINNSGSPSKIDLEIGTMADYCSYQEAMNQSIISPNISDIVRRHIKVLIDERSEKSIDG